MSFLSTIIRSPQTRTRLRTGGAALILVVFFFITISLAVIQSATMGAVIELRTYRTIASSKAAYVAAEAGIEDIYYRTINGKAIPSSETITLNNATSTVTVSTVSSTQKDVYAVGSATNNEVRKLYLSITQTKDVNINFAGQAGEGGIIMGINTTIDGTGLDKGNLYSNGQIIGTTGVSITGNVISSSAVAADQVASSTICTNDEVLGLSNPNIDYAQSFMISGTTSDALPSVSFYLKRVGNPVSANIRITADNAGVPATTALATQPIVYSTTGTTYGWVTINFASPPTLNPNTLYWVVLDTTQNATKYWTWCRSNTDTYATGTAKYKQDWSTGGGWTTLPGDMAFITFGGGISKIDSVHVSGTAMADVITGATIGGNAYYKTITGSTVGGTSYPGSVTPPYTPLPIASSTIAQWKADATLGGTINGNCGNGGVAACNTFPLSLGPVKINGNLTVATSRSLTVNGTIYVTGNLDINDTGTVSCALAFGAGSCLIVVDGYVNATNNAILQGSGTPGSYIMVLSTKQGCLGSGGTGCATNYSGIELSNNITGALFYASDSMIDISDNALVTAVVGYMLQLRDHAEIKFDSKVSTLNILPSWSSSFTGAWNVNRWNEY
jgi:hypothetical protein